MDSLILLQGRIMYLEQENAYLKDLLARWSELFSLETKARMSAARKAYWKARERGLFSLTMKKEDKDAKETK